MDAVKSSYKLTDIGAIPEDWALCSLSDLGTFSKGRGIKKDEVVSDGIPCVRYGEIYTHHNDYIKAFYSFIPKNVALQSQRLRNGDLLFAGSGETAEEIGKCVAFLGEQDVYAGGDIVIFTPRDQNSMYLGYLMNHPLIIRQKMMVAQGDAVVHITARHLGQLLLPVPPLPEQHAIAEVLSDIDAQIAALDTLIAKKRDIKQGAMQELLTGKKRLPGFSGEWEVVKFEDLADKNIKWSIVGGPFGSNLKASDYVSEGIRIIQLQNIGDGQFHDDYAIYTTEHKANELISCNIYPGEIILSKMGDPVARACFVPNFDKRYLMASDGIRLAVDENRFDKYFVLHYINSYFREKAIQASSGSTRQRIGLTDLKNLPFVSPPHLEQKAIGEVLSSMIAEITMLEEQRKKAVTLKQGMMQELLTGKTRLV